MCLTRQHWRKFVLSLLTGDPLCNQASFVLLYGNIGVWTGPTLSFVSYNTLMLCFAAVPRLVSLFFLPTFYTPAIFVPWVPPGPQRSGGSSVSLSRLICPERPTHTHWAALHVWWKSTFLHLSCDKHLILFYCNLLFTYLVCYAAECLSWKSHPDFFFFQAIPNLFSFQIGSSACGHVAWSLIGPFLGLFVPNRH